jgi:tRNA (guanine37-N1)-methyltransferase
MRFDVLTLFPEMFPGYLGQSLLKLAIENSLVAVHLHNLRDWAGGRHRVVDDRPFGGGPGMILKPEPIVECVEAVQAGKPPPNPADQFAAWRSVGHIAGAPGQDKLSMYAQDTTHNLHPSEHVPANSVEPEPAGLQPGHLVMLTPQGRKLTQSVVKELAARRRILLLCGRYEGFDDRIRQLLQPDEISIGDFVLGGGEVAAMVVIDAVIRLIPGVLGDAMSAVEDSFSGAEQLLEGPQFTRPRDYRGLSVPEVLLRGNHAEILAWRQAQSLQKTRERRADLLPDNRLNMT